MQLLPFSADQDWRFGDRTSKKFMRSINERLVHFHIAATDNIYIIVIIDSTWFSHTRHNLAKMIQISNLYFSLSQSVTKTLLVTILDRPYYNKYKYWLRRIPDLRGKLYLYNIDVLEIAIRQSQKRSAPRINYRVIQFDFFRKILRKTKYLSKTKFFIDSMKNSHKLRLQTADFLSMFPYERAHAEFNKRQYGINGTLSLVNRSRDIFFNFNPAPKLYIMLSNVKKKLSTSSEAT